MRDRACRNCKHFEPAPLRNKGWCRNPLLYGPQQSHLVDQNTIDCTGRTGDFWEAADPDDVSIVETAGTGEPGKALSERGRLRLFEAPPQPVPPVAGERVADDRAQPTKVSDHRPDESVKPVRTRGEVVNRTGLPQGQERTVSYEPEERYWTDYLRIALPVVGLLLMLGLFWYWASAVIGDDENEPRPTSTPAVAALVTEAVPSPTPTQPVTINVEEVSPTPEPTNNDGGSSGDDEPTEEPTDEPSGDGGDEPTDEAPGEGFQAGDRVVTTDSVNLRADRSTESDVIEALEPGVELEVLREAREAEGYFWIYVRDTNNDQEGYVADEFVELAE